MASTAPRFDVRAFVLAFAVCMVPPYVVLGLTALTGGTTGIKVVVLGSAITSLISAVAIGWGVVRLARRHPAAGATLLGALVGTLVGLTGFLPAIGVF